MQSKIFTLRFTPEQFNQLSAESDADGMKLGELIRYRLGFESKTHAKQMIFLLNKTSNNINQIAKGINIANLHGKLDTGTYTQALDRLAGITIDFKNIYSLVKEVKNVD